MAQAKRNADLHSEKSQGRNLAYYFHPKHHGKGASKNATWNVSREVEFAIFDYADWEKLSDTGHSLYGAVRGDRGLRVVGTWGQQIAKFPFAKSGPWHGYPLHPLTGEQVPQAIRRRAKRFIPPDEVLDKMQQCGLIDEGDRIRILRGDHV